jgi:hypothetical protein
MFVRIAFVKCLRTVRPDRREVQLAPSRHVARIRDDARALYSNQSSSDAKPISTPAGRPCRVMTISSSAANRRYFEKSSFTSASATALGAACPRALLFEPGLRLFFRDDGEDLDLRFRNVIEHPDVVNGESILRLAQAAKSFDRILLTRLGSCRKCRSMASKVGGNAGDRGLLDLLPAIWEQNDPGRASRVDDRRS